MVIAVVASLSAVFIAQSHAADPNLTQSGLVVHSSRNPAITLSVASEFIPLAPILLSLPSTEVDRRVFVKVNASKRIERMVIFQFERVRADSSFKFVYAPKPPFTFGGNVYRLGTYIYDDQAEAKASPGLESEATREALTGAGYGVPRFFRTARLARVADPTGSSELIIFYLEDADADFPAGLLPGADSDGDLALKGSDVETLLRRMEYSVTANADNTHA
jgi:hypothetical protein